MWEVSAAQRPRAKLPGGSGQTLSILARAGGPGTLPNDLARRVSFSELLGGPPYSWTDQLDLSPSLIDGPVSTKDSVS